MKTVESEIPYQLHDQEEVYQWKYIDKQDQYFEIPWP